MKEQPRATLRIFEIVILNTSLVDLEAVTEISKSTELNSPPCGPVRM